MDTYRAPLAEQLFVLRELAGSDVIAHLPGYEDATPDVIEAVLREAATFGAEVLAPLNQIGDRQGSRLVDGNVITAAGFAAAYQAFVAAGWPGLIADKARGGQGLPNIVAVAVNEIWQSANLSFSLCPMITQAAVLAIEAHGSETLRTTYLPKLVTGEWTGCMDLTEPQAGSDLAALRTRAEPEGDHYRLTGQKIFITWGDHDGAENILHLVLARLPDAPPGVKGISMFLVPKFLVAANGAIGARNEFRPIAVEHKLGIHASPTCVMEFSGAIGYLVGPPHEGLACMFTMMNRARLAVGMQGLCLSERAYQRALAYARERIQGRAADGRAEHVPIIEHADVRRMLLLQKAGIEAMRAFCYTTGAELDLAQRGPESERGRHEARFALLTPVLKGWCTELAQELVSLAMQVHGGMGYIEETGAAQYVRDARISTIYEGTTTIQAQDLLGRKVLRDGGAALDDLLADIQASADALTDTEHDELRVLHRRLAHALGLLRAAHDWVRREHARDPHAIGAAAANFLMLFGTVCGGWQMARAALGAMRQHGDARRARLITAAFYADHFLPRCDGYLQAILAGSGRLMALPNDAF
ncbi:MAG: acyl-CoA dehydrogenase [Gammaproteobacteria bacterium]|nr:acyl-CoA dehydrogenase [Gammaproteobacteria bacterium]